jgi:hypothetical protein
VVSEYEPPPDDAPQPVAWHEEETLRELLGPSTQITRHSIRFGGASAAAWVAEQREHHPAWAALQETIPPDRFEELCGELTEMLASLSEDRDSFAVSSPYVLARGEA